jgi:hypothetical protein
VSLLCPSSLLALLFFHYSPECVEEEVSSEVGQEFIQKSSLLASVCMSVDTAGLTRAALDAGGGAMRVRP